MLNSPGRRSDRRLPPPQATGLTPRPFLLIAITLYLLFNQLSACMAGLGPALNGQADFRAYYAAGYIIRTHHASQLYDRDFERQVQSAVVTPRTADLPFVYPPFSALLFAPLSLLSYRNAYFAFFAINIVLALIAATLMHPHLRTMSLFWRPLPYVLFLGFFPVAIAFMQGQASLVLLLCYCASYIALQNDKSFLAGLFLSIAAIKFQIAIPVVVLFLIWRRWRVVSGFLSGCAALAALSAWIIGPHALLNYMGSLVHIAGTVSAGTAGAASTHNDMFVPERMPNIHGLISELFLQLPTTAHTVTILTAILSLATFLWAARKPASLPFALLTAMLISYHMQPHDLTLMLLPLSLAIEQWMIKPATHAKPLIACAAVALILLTPPIPLLLIGTKLSALLVLPIAILALWITSNTQLRRTP